MAKQKKKRNKAYRGRDAKVATPQVIRVEAANRSTLSQWWFERKRILKPVLIAALVVVVLAWLLIELFRAVL